MCCCITVISNIFKALVITVNGFVTRNTVKRILVISQGSYGVTLSPFYFEFTPILGSSCISSLLFLWNRLLYWVTVRGVQFFEFICIINICRLHFDFDNSARATQCSNLK